jgi:ribosomal-protein-alanine N-acetyltransferase
VTTIRLVPFTEEHVPALQETMRDPDVLRFTRTPDPMPDGWVHEYVGRFDGEHRAGFAIMEGDDFVGYAVTGPIDRDGLEVELGYAISPWGRGRGIATETLRQLTQWAFDAGMMRAVALISVDNPASSRVAQKAGYTLEGVLRSMHHRDGHRGDMESWSMLPGDQATTPPS